MKKITVFTNGQIAGALYAKKDGTFTTKSPNDIFATKFAIIIIGATLLGTLSHFA